MSTVVLGIRVVLAGVFLTAGVAKLFDLPTSRKSVEEFGVPESMARVVGTALPLAEVATAVALVLRPSARWGAVAALVLLLAFIAGISRAMSQGKAPDCNCFGQIHSSPAGRGTLARNAGLAVLAAIATWRGPGPSIATWVEDRTAAELVAVLSVVALMLLVVFAMRTWLEARTIRADLAEAKEVVAKIPPGLWVGAMAPDFEVPADEFGPGFSLADLRARGLPIALVFVGPGCGPCEVLIPEVVQWQTTMANRLTIAFVGRGTREHYAKHLETGTIETTPEWLQSEIDANYEIFDAYGVIATPSAVILTPEGTIASATVDGRLGIQSLIRLTLERFAPRQPLVEPGHAQVA